MSKLTRFIEANPGMMLVIDYDDTLCVWVIRPMHRPHALQAHASASILRGALRKLGCYQHTVRLWEISHETTG